VFAVMKKGRKRALRLLESESEANALASEESGYIEFRVGESKRCQNYCNVAKFCTQFQSMNKPEGEESA
jgi:methionine salvage enolase-phosphatase E1